MADLSSEEQLKVHHSFAPSCRKLEVVRQMTFEQGLSRTSRDEGVLWGKGWKGKNLPWRGKFMGKEIPGVNTQDAPDEHIRCYTEVILLTRLYIYASPLLPAFAQTLVVCFRVDGFEITVLRLLLFALWRCVYIQCVFPTHQLLLLLLLLSLSLQFLLTTF